MDDVNIRKNKKNNGTFQLIKMPPNQFKQRTSTQRAAQRQLKLHLKRIRNKEYSRLREMVPSIATKDKVSKVGGFHSNKVQGIKGS